jgi:hypothetical protein
MATNETKASRIKQTYKDRRKNASFSGLPAFIENSEFKDKAEVARALSFVDAYTLHRPVRKKFPRRMYRVPWLGFEFGMDLMSTQNMSQFNKNINYILIVQDLFSRFIFTAFLKTKSAPDVLKGIKAVFKKVRAVKLSLPTWILVDEGKEWFNSTVLSFLAEKNVKLFSSRSGIHAAHTERAIRTLRDKLARYQTAHNTKDFLGGWDTIVRNFNNTKNKTTGYKPSEINVSNQDQVFLNAYSKIIGAKAKKLRLHVGQLVRVSRAKLSTFSKSSEQSYSTEIFRIAAAEQSVPVNFYYLEDLDKVPIIGTFYFEELVPVNIPEPSQESRKENVTATAKESPELPPETGSVAENNTT